MTTPSHAEFDIPTLRYGLNTRDRPQDLAPGEAKQADCAWLYRSLATPPGLDRIISYRPQQAAVILNGFDQHFSCRVPTGTYLSLKGDAAPYNVTNSTFAIFATPFGIKSGQYVAFKTPAGSTTPTTYTAGSFDYLMQLVGTSNGKLALEWKWEDAGGTVRTVTTAGLIIPNLTYALAVTMDKASGDVTLSVLLAGIEDPSNPQFALVGSTVTNFGAGSGNVYPKDRAGHFLLGSWRKQYPQRPWDYTHPDHCFFGKLQDARFYNGFTTLTVPTQGTINDPSLETCYPLTEKGPIEFADIFGVSPTLEIQPRDAKWIATPFDGIRFDGLTDHIRARDAFRYRQPKPNGDGEYPTVDKPIINWVGQVKELKNGATLLHFAQNTKSFVTNDAGLPQGAAAAPWIPYSGSGHVAYSGTVGYDPPRAQFQLQIVENPAAAGQFEFRVVFWFYRTAGPNSPNWDGFSLPSRIGGLTLNTTYHVTASCDYTNGDVKLYINGSTAVGFGNTGTNGISNMVPLNTADDPVGAAVNFNFVMGAPIRSSMLGGADPSNPNDSNLKFNFASSGITEGCAAFVDVDRVAFLDGAITDYLANSLLVQEIDRKSIQSLGATVLSAWNFTEGRGSTAQDTGILLNALAFRHDARHLRGRSGILTTEKGKVHGYIEYTYPADDGSGDVTKILGLHDGGADEVNETDNRFDAFAEGFRNDLDALPSIVKYRDSLLIAVGSGSIMQLWKNNLWRAAIDRPQGPFPWGLTNQNKKKAALLAGRYVAQFVYYNAYLDKESPPSEPIVINAKARRFDLAFGDTVESNQFPPTSGESTLKEPWDFEGKKNRFIRVWHWVEPAETAPGGGGNEAVPKRWKITDKQGLKLPGIDEIDDVKARELSKIGNKQLPRARVIDTPEGRLELLGRYVGASAKLRFDDPASGEPAVSEVGGTAWNAIKATNILGAAWTSDIPIPQGEGDNQITHVRLYRTLADGVDRHLVAEFPIRKRTIHDAKKDADNIDQILDLDVSGPPEDARFIVEQFGRLWVWGDPLNPGSVYGSEVGQPHFFLPTSVVKLGDGDTNKIVAMGRTEGQLIAMKRNDFIVLHEPRNPQMPFHPEHRSSATGGAAPFGVINNNDRLYWPAELGFHSYGGDEPRLISDVIQPTWAAIPGIYRDRIVSAHWRRFEVMLWAAPSGLSFAADGVTPINDLIFAWFYGVSTPDGRTRGWSKLVGINVKAFALIRNADGDEELWIVDDFGFPYRFNPASYDWGVGSHASPDFVKSGTFTGTMRSNSVDLPTAPLEEMPEGYVGLQITITYAATGTRVTRFIVDDDLGDPVSEAHLDHVLAVVPIAGDTYEIGAIEMDWKSGFLYPFGYEHVGKMFETFLEQTAQTQAAEYQVTYTPEVGTLVEKPTVTKNVANNTQDALVTHEGRARRYTLGVLARGINKPCEIGQFTTFVERPERGERKSHRL